MAKNPQLIRKGPLAVDNKDLIARCIAGDESGYKALYDLYADAMYNTSFRLVNDQTEAEDLVQEAFVDAFKNMSGFENRSSFATWLKRILIHKCINFIKKKKISLVELNEAQLETMIEDSSSNDEEIEWHVNKILKAIGLLPDLYRVVVSLYLLEGYDHEEIAGITRLPEPTIRTQYARGKKKIMDIMKKMN